MERGIPFVWKGADSRRILNPNLSLKNQILLLIASCSTKVAVDDLIRWTEVKNKTYFKKTLQNLHCDRLVELNEQTGEVELLPPGDKFVLDILSPRTS